jgi:hypothetical protein
MWICERDMRAHDFRSVAWGGVGRVCAHGKTARQAQMHLHALGYYVRCEVGAKRARMADEGYICGIVQKLVTRAGSLSDCKRFLPLGSGIASRLSRQIGWNLKPKRCSSCIPSAMTLDTFGYEATTHAMTREPHRAAAANVESTVPDVVAQ